MKPLQGFIDLDKPSGCDMIRLAPNFPHREAPLPPASPERGWRLSDTIFVCAIAVAVVVALGYAGLIAYYGSGLFDAAMRGFE